MTARFSLITMPTAHSEFFTPRRVAPHNLLRMNVKYTCCSGRELFTAAGQRALANKGSLLARIEVRI